MDGKRTKKTIIAMNIGKIFETQFRISTPEYALLCRLPDDSGSFSGGDLRFSLKSPFDYILWDSKRKRLYALELKTVSGMSISFERSKEESGKIHYHQIKGLTTWSSFDGVYAGFFIEFRALEKTIFLPIDAFNKLSETIDKKSFRLDDLDTYGISYIVVPQKKVRTRYRYDIDWFLENY